MRALAIVHQPDAGPGVFAQAVGDSGWELEAWPITEGLDPPEDPLRFDAVFTFGASAHADQEAHHPWMAAEKAVLESLLHAGRPLLGVCLGAQLVAEAAGAPARRASEPEIGWYDVRVTEDGSRDPLIGPLAPGFTAFQWHSYECLLPPGAVALATSPVCLQAYRIGQLVWGIQFHAEVVQDDALAWIEAYGSDPDALALGVDPDGLRAQSAEAMEGWNELGRGLCRRFLEASAAAEGV